MDAIEDRAGTTDTGDTRPTRDEVRNIVREEMAGGMPAVTLPHAPRSMVDRNAPDYGGVALDPTRGVPMATPAATAIAGVEQLLRNARAALETIGAAGSADLTAAGEKIDGAIAALRDHATAAEDKALADGAGTAPSPARPPATQIPAEQRVPDAEGAKAGVPVDLPVTGAPAVTATSEGVKAQVEEASQVAPANDAGRQQMDAALTHNEAQVETGSTETPAASVPLAPVEAGATPAPSPSPQGGGEQAAAAEGRAADAPPAAPALEGRAADAPAAAPAPAAHETAAL